jgi:hypothetical protein
LKHGVPPTVNCRAFIVLNIYKWPSPENNSVAEPVLFADNTSVLISSRNFCDFCTVSNLVLSHMIKWFATNKLLLKSR